MAFAITPNATARPQMAAVLHHEERGAASTTSPSPSAAVAGGDGVGSIPGSKVERFSPAESPDESPDESTADGDISVGDISVVAISGKSHIGQPV